MVAFAETHFCEPKNPPIPLILGGWFGSNDQEKRTRWEQTVAWAHANGCDGILETLAEDDFYVVAVEATYVVSPMGGPMYRTWDFTPKERPQYDVLEKQLCALRVSWKEHLEAVWHHTAPLGFSGAKARRLVVVADPEFTPPWGTWDSRLSSATERTTFTSFRSRINSLLSGHEVDHVDFITAAWSTYEEHESDQN